MSGASSCFGSLLIVNTLRRMRVLSWCQAVDGSGTSAAAAAKPLSDASCAVDWEDSESSLVEGRTTAAYWALSDVK